MFVAAPDGSLFIADWYDPGVGGHQMGDINRGRIYRISTTTGNYKPGTPNFETQEGLTQALISPNGATRYLAWQKLHSLGAQAEPALQKLWTSENPRSRARAFWLLARIPGKEDQYLQQALADKDPDIRITGIRAARQIKDDVIPYLQKVVNDADPQVRREVAIALHQNKSNNAGALWAQLAAQYDGQDRWYLEALGIGADKQWDTFIPIWQSRSAEQVNTPAGRDIIWRSRTSKALPLLAAHISDTKVDSASRLRYFRAFDFINSPEKEKTLLALLENTGPKRDEIVLTALNHINAETLPKSPKLKAALYETLASTKGTRTFVDLVGRYKLKDQNELFCK